MTATVQLKDRRRTIIIEGVTKWTADDGILSFLTPGRVYAWPHAEVRGVEVNVR